MCEKIRAFFSLPYILQQFWDWAFDANGDATQDFKNLFLTIGAPAGSVVWWGGPNIPTGWLLCNGQTVSRTTYASLFAAIGTTWGVGDGSTTFALPDARGRVLAHANGSSFVFGASTGAESHTLTTAEIPSHSHLCSGQGVDNALVPVGYYGAFSPVGNAQPFSTDATGGGTAHANIQPCLVGYHLIKT